MSYSHNVTKAALEHMMLTSALVDSIQNEKHFLEYVNKLFSSMLQERQERIKQEEQEMIRLTRAELQKRLAEIDEELELLRLRKVSRPTVIDILSTESNAASQSKSAVCALQINYNLLPFRFSVMNIYINCRIILFLFRKNGARNKRNI